MLKASKFVEIVWTSSILLCFFTTKNGITVRLSIHLSKICVAAKKAKNASRPLAKVTSSDSKNLYINYKNFACFSYNLI